MGVGRHWQQVRGSQEHEAGFLSALFLWVREGCVPLLKAVALLSSPLHPLVLVSVHPPTLSGSQLLLLIAPEYRGFSTHYSHFVNQPFIKLSASYPESVLFLPRLWQIRFQLIFKDAKSDFINICASANLTFIREFAP